MIEEIEIYGNFRAPTCSILIKKSMCFFSHGYANYQTRFSIALARNNRLESSDRGKCIESNSCPQQSSLISLVSVSLDMFRWNCEILISEKWYSYGLRGFNFPVWKFLKKRTKHWIEEEEKIMKQNLFLKLKISFKKI